MNSGWTSWNKWARWKKNNRVKMAEFNDIFFSNDTKTIAWPPPRAWGIVSPVQRTQFQFHSFSTRARPNYPPAPWASLRLRFGLASVASWFPESFSASRPIVSAVVRSCEWGSRCAPSTPPPRIPTATPNSKCETLDAPVERWNFQPDIIEKSNLDNLN